MAKIVLITGASQGIGAQIAKRFARGGFTVAINCRGQKELENGGKEVAEACRALGAEAECFPADVSKFDECGALVQAVVERFGGLDALVNNAGITRDGLLVRMSEDQYDAVIAVNQKSVFNMMHHAGKVMMHQKSGRIVSISSVAGLYGNAGQINYSASKAAIIGMTKTAAKELGPRGVTVNAVAPGFVETPMTAVLGEKVREAALKGISLGRYAQPADIANAVFFLASDEAAYITGQVLAVDGGMSM